MKFISEKQVGDDRKISFSDQDEWGYTGKGIVFITNQNYQVTGLELYTARFGVIRCDQIGKITYCQGWEKDHVKQGIGISDHFATKLISTEKESLDLYEKIFNHIYTSLQVPYLRHVLHELLNDKRKIRLDIETCKKISGKNIESLKKSVASSETKKGLLNRILKK